jgi:hypothetical protein
VPVLVPVRGSFRCTRLHGDARRARVGEAREPFVCSAFAGLCILVRSVAGGGKGCQNRLKRALLYQLSYAPTPFQFNTLIP